MKVKKRNGNPEDFNLNKILDAVTKAFKSEGYNTDNNDFEVFDELKIEFSTCPEDINVEEIQDRVEKILMDYAPYKVAKAFILYREKHRNIREFANKKIKYINNFIESDNTANATIDDNSNVSNHNIAVLNSEIHKEENQEVNLKILENKLRELYPEFDYKQMRKDFSTIMYQHDLNSQIGMPYCVAITLYPFLLNGIKEMGGLSASPKNIDSFCGMFINLVFAISSQFKGAVATPGLFLCMDWYLRKEWGDNYNEKMDLVISSPYSKRKQTLKKQIHQYFQQICYSLMQPSAARGSQAVFWNVSVFDRPFYDTMYENFYFPDGTAPVWESFDWLQKEFVHWLNEERLKCILTFPVVSCAIIYKDGKFLDEGMYHFICREYSEGNSFFTYISDSADSLSSCCRLSSKIEKPQFNFTNGQLSEMTGSKNVITLNLNRIIQDWAKELPIDCNSNCILSEIDNGYSSLKKYIIEILERLYKYQISYNSCLEELEKANMLSVYKAGFISMSKQYLTIGINGLNQAAEYLGIECTNNEDYRTFCNFIFSTIKEQNTKHNTSTIRFNTEFTPCESAAIKLFDRDKKDGYWVPQDTNLYASYIYKPNDSSISILDKIIMHGKDYIGDMLDGGSSAHLNLDTHLSRSQYEKLVTFAAENGCKYFTFNIPNCECEECGYIAKHPFKICPKCNSANVSLWDRVIGYLTKIKNWSSGRQIEQKTRVYSTIKDNL